MQTKKKVIGVIAATAALAFASTALTSTMANAASSKVDCYGVNGCKGKSSCKTSKNECKGNNSCKGKGFVKMSAKKCEKKGGTTTEPTETSK